jgi:PPM family protein phosphatase
MLRRMAFVLESASLSNVGLVRKRNEDVWGEAPEQGLFVVADGMGGHLGGDVAARLTVNTILAYLKTVEPEKAMAELPEAIRLANEAVLAKASTDRSLYGMGATVVVCWERDGEMVYAHVGDSRIYLLRGGELRQLTEDHSLVTQLLSSGQISEQEAERFIYKHVITRAIGTRRRILADVDGIGMLPGDIFLLCTDGLTDGVSDDEIRTVLNTTSDVEVMAQKLVDAALEAGGKDNVTVTLLQVKNGA